MKCIWKINTHKMTSRTLTPCYFGFWAQFQYGAFKHHKYRFNPNDFNTYVRGFSQKYVVVRLHVLIVWHVQHGLNLNQKEVSYLEKVGFLFGFEHKNNPQSLFKGEPSTSSNFQVPSTYTLNVIKLAYVSSWPTFCCGKKVRRPLMFKLMQRHTNNWEADKLFSPSTSLPLVDV